MYRLFHTDSNDTELFRSGKWLLPFGLRLSNNGNTRIENWSLTELYKKLSSKIFPFSRVLLTTQYSHESLEEELKSHFDKLKLTTTDTSPKLFVVTKRSTDTQPYLLRNYDVTPTDDNSFHQGCSDWFCCDAAPTCFKPFVFN